MDNPRLVILTGPVNGSVVDIDRASVLVGRAADCDVVLDDPRVSRAHAILARTDGRTLIRDLGSTAGTVINGNLCHDPVELHDGDRVRFAEIEVLYQDPGPKPAYPSGTDHVAPAIGVHGSSDRNIGLQQADVIGNAERDLYIQQFNEKRESFAREIAARKTKARFAVWSGLTLVIIGFAVYGWGFAHFANFNDSQNSSMSSFHIMMIGVAVAGTGMVTIGVGVVLHVVAAARKKQEPVVPEFPPPWIGGMGPLR